MLLATLVDVWPLAVTFNNRRKVAIAPRKVNCGTLNQNPWSGLE